MNCHINVVFVTDRHDSFQEVFQIGKECFLVHILVHFKELLDFCHTLRLPAGKDKTIGVGGNGIKHFHRIDAVHSLLAISKYRGAVRAYSCKLSAGPVKDRHEIVAYKMNILFAKALQGLNIIVNIFVSVRRTDLDGIVNIHTFDAGKIEPGSIYFRLAGMDFLAAP